MIRLSGPFRLRPLLPALALALTLAACSDAGEDGDEAGREDRGTDGSAEEAAARGPGVGTVVEGQDWGEPFLREDLEVCGDVAVWGSSGGTPVVVHADGTSVELEPEVPDDTEVELGEAAAARTSCLLDDRGEPVVVVELRDGLDDGGPALLVGFDADGRQLWTYDALLDVEVSTSGTGAVVVGTRESQEFAVVDAATGEELVRRDTGAPTVLDPVPLSTELLQESGAVVTLDGEPVAEGMWAEPVDPDRALVEVQVDVPNGTDNAVALVDLSTGERIWAVRGYGLGVETASVDASTGVAVLVDDDDVLHGLDLATGEERWVSDAPVGTRGVESIGQGLAVLPSRDFATDTLVDTATGEQLPALEHEVAVGSSLVVVVTESGIPAIATVDDLR